MAKDGGLQTQSSAVLQDIEVQHQCEAVPSGPSQPTAELLKIREMFTRSLRNFKYDKHTPLIVLRLGADAVGVANSGVEEVCPPPPRGRPPKRRLSPRRDGVTPKVSRVSSFSDLIFV